MKRPSFTVLCCTLLMAAACLILLMPSAALTVATPEFPIHLLCGDARWSSYADYTQGLLSVDYQIGNGGTVNAYNVTVTGASVDMPVTRVSGIPIWMGDMAPGDWDTQTIRFHVPSGVLSFRTTLSICSTCDGTICVDGASGGIDIKPGSCPNSIRINGGDIAVAVFSYGSFDAGTLDPATVVFAGAPTTHWAAEDKNGDSIDDMVFHFDRVDTDLQDVDTRACLSGSLIGGGTFRSCDMVRMIS